MIESIKIINFQSLTDLELDLGKFTVIVGPSSSGKSALTRAMKAVTSNALGSDNITRGTKYSAVSLRTGEATVTIEREVGGSSVYKIAEVGREESRFARINRQVPAEVTAALGILPSTQEVASINFAGQFDTPYLLKEGASSVARTLGELTNVSTIFSAVREASKRAKNASTLVNLRRKDRDKLVAEIRLYTNVTAELKAVALAEDKIEASHKLQSRISLLSDLFDRATMASQALRSLKDIPELPDLDALMDTQKKLNTFKDCLRTVALARKNISDQDASIVESESAILLTDDELHRTLMEAGTCPTCNRGF